MNLNLPEKKTPYPIRESIKKYPFSILILMAVVFFHSTAAYADMVQKKNTIVLFPFSVVSSENVEIMVKGIDMILKNRLMEKGAVLSPPPVAGQDIKKTQNIDDAIRLSAPLNGTHAVYGSVVKFGTAITTDAFLIDTASREILIRFHDTGTGDDALSKHVNIFAEKAMSALSPASSDLPPTRKAPVYQWKSQRFEGRINGITAGDLKKDSRIEFAVAFDKKITICSWADGILKEQDTILFPTGAQIIGVDSADLNGNGIPELFVSVIDRDNRSFASSIIEWDGSKYKTIQSGLKWIFRSVMPAAQGKPVVMCQKHNSLNQILGSPICFFEYKNGSYDSASPVPAAENINLYGFASTLAPNEPLTAFYDSRNRIKVIDKTGGIIWESEEQFGGGSVYLSVKNETDRDKIDRYYMEPRILFSNLISEGDLITIKNNESTRHLFTGIKNYSTGQIAIFSKNLTGFTQTYITPAASGYISDFMVFDITKDKRSTLIYSLVTGNNNFFGKQSSYIIIQEINR